MNEAMQTTIAATQSILHTPIPQQIFAINLPDPLFAPCSSSNIATS
jgi:hypothetical protein